MNAFHSIARIVRMDFYFCGYLIEWSCYDKATNTMQSVLVQSFFAVSVREHILSSD